MSKYSRNNIALISGSSNPLLAQKIARLLGVHLTRREISAFPNNEVRIRILGELKDKNVFILQSTNHLAERSIIELSLLADSTKRLGAKRIVALIPWFGYTPQDKVFRKGEPLSSEIITRMLEASPIDEFVVIDIHSPLNLEYFKKPVHHLSAMGEFIKYFKNKLKGDWCSVALDNGARERAKEFADALKVPLASFDKTRHKKTGEVTMHCLEGNVSGMNVISFDDFVSTGGTRIKGSAFLKQEGAKKYLDCVTHLLVPETIQNIEESTIDKMYITDSIFLEPKWKSKKIKVLTITPILADFIKQY